MKVFWSILAVLAIAATVLLAMPRRGGGAATGTSEPSARDAEPTRRTERPVQPDAPMTEPKTQGKSEPNDEPETETPAPPPAAARDVAVTKPAEEIKPTPPPPPEKHAAVPAPSATPTPAASADLKPAPAVATNDTPAAAAPELPEKLNELVEAALGGGEAGPAPAPKAAPGAKPAADAVAPAAAKIETKEDGSMMVDGRYPIKGKGTKAEPYEITWDYLISAEETYKPRLGQKNLPARMDIVKGKWVKVTGYVAFPIMAQEADEMLAMLNQWDGCCIGVPPTPYDAIEVKLRDPAEKEDRFAVYGTVTGKLEIEPYLVKDWLIGLYTMSDAVLRAER